MNEPASAFESFIASRDPDAPPSDFDLLVLDVILSMYKITSQSNATSTPTVESPKPPLPASHQHHIHMPQRSPDRAFPVALLKCPLSVFTRFCKVNILPSAVIKALRDARRRKTNRKFQRISRNRRRGMYGGNSSQTESDDEGDCHIIDDKAVLKQLMRVPGFALAMNNA